MVEASCTRTCAFVGRRKRPAHTAAASMQCDAHRPHMAQVVKCWFSGTVQEEFLEARSLAAGVNETMSTLGSA